MRSAASCARASLRATIASLAPCAASTSAAASPMPLVAPVIRICLLSTDIVCTRLVLCYKSNRRLQDWRQIVTARAITGHFRTRLGDSPPLDGEGLGVG